MNGQQQQRRDALIFEHFLGINTATTRAGVPDQQAAWLDGFMPLAPRYARTLWDIGPALYTASGKTIVCYVFYNLGSTPYVILFLSDGSAVQVNTTTGAATTVMPTGTILNPAINQIAASQWSSLYLLITANQTNGYWIWDGTILYSAGSLAPGVTLTNVGSGYYAPPVVSVSGGHGSSTSLVAAISGGQVTSVAIVNAGAGYLGTDSPTLVFSGGNAAGSGGSLAAILSSAPAGSGGSISATWTPKAFSFPYAYFAPSVSIAAAGSGYYALTTAGFTNPPTNNAWYGNGVPTVNLTLSGGLIDAVALTPASNNTNMYYDVDAAAGAGYFLSPSAASATAAGGTVLNFASGWYSSYNPTGWLVWDYAENPGAISPGTTVTGYSATTATISKVVNSPGVASGDGIWFANPAAFPGVSITSLGYYSVSSVSIIAAGSDYGPSASINVSGGGQPQVQAQLTPVLASGSITNVDIVNPGVYLSNTVPTVSVTDSAITAAGSVTLMPFGIQGTALTTYQGHVWVFNRPNFNFTAPGSVSNFATSAGGGSQQSSVPYLRVGYTNAVSTNGFLFLIGDSSMDYISGVQTTTPSGGSPTTTYTQNNSDPEQGTPYPAAITTLGQDILMANPTGVFISAGGEFQKISEMLDGVYNTVPASGFNTNPFNGFQLSAAKATIFGKRVWMVLVPIIDPVSGLQVNKLLMFRDNGKIWWASQQGVALTFIASQEINSVYTAWGTDGAHLYPLFQTPSTAFTKTAQSRYWDPMGYEFNDTANRFWSLWECFNTSGTNFTVNIDAVGIGSAGQYTNSATYSITGPTSMGYFATPPQSVGQQGVLIGMTIMTNAADMALISAKISPQAYNYRG